MVWGGLVWGGLVWGCVVWFCCCRLHPTPPQTTPTCLKHFPIPSHDTQFEPRHPRPQQIVNIRGGVLDDMGSTAVHLCMVTPGTPNPLLLSQTIPNPFPNHNGLKTMENQAPIYFKPPPIRYQTTQPTASSVHIVDFD